MRRIGWTSLTVLLALLIALALASAATASPGAVRTCATLRFSLNLGDAVAQPFDRWLTELAGMTALTIDSATWDGGEAMALRLAMNGKDAWEVSFLAEDDGVSMESSLMAEGAVSLRAADALEARALMAGLRGAIGVRGNRTLTAGEVAGLSRFAAVTMGRWGTAAAGTDGDACSAISDFLSAFADIADQSKDSPWLKVTVEPMETDDAPVAAPGGREAPEELPGVLAMEAFWATMRAVAAE